MYVHVQFFTLKLRFASYLINEYVVLCYDVTLTAGNEDDGGEH